MNEMGRMKVNYPDGILIKHLLHFVRVIDFNFSLCKFRYKMVYLSLFHSLFPYDFLITYL